jgi:hypothetical protein
MTLSTPLLSPQATAHTTSTASDWPPAASGIRSRRAPPGVRKGTVRAPARRRPVTPPALLFAASIPESRMESLWSPGLATSGNQPQTKSPANRENKRNPLRPATTGCVRPFHGKEGVDGSSPSEGSAKAPQPGLFLSDRLVDRADCPRYGAVYGALRIQRFFLSRENASERRFWYDQLERGRREHAYSNGVVRVGQVGS